MNVLQNESVTKISLAVGDIVPLHNDKICGRLVFLNKKEFGFHEYDKKGELKFFFFIIIIILMMCVKE